MAPNQQGPLPPGPVVRPPAEKKQWYFAPVPPDSFCHEDLVRALPGAPELSFKKMTSWILKLLMFNIIAAMFLVHGGYYRESAVKNQAVAARDLFVRLWVQYHGSSKAGMKTYIKKTMEEFLEKKDFRFNLQNGSGYISICVPLPADCLAPHLTDCLAPHPADIGKKALDTYIRNVCSSVFTARSKLGFATTSQSEEVSS